MKTSHITWTLKILTDLCFTKQKRKTKTFARVVYSLFRSKNVLAEHKEICWSINGTQSVIFEKGTIEFKNYFKQISVPFKFYADFECNLNSVESHEGFYSKIIKITLLAVLLTNLFVLMINLVSQLLFTEVKMELINLLKKFLKRMNTVKR